VIFIILVFITVIIIVIIIIIIIIIIIMSSHREIITITSNPKIAKDMPVTFDLVLLK
jgi:hypothetical protein